MGQPREFFGTRDIDQLHDWTSDVQHYQLEENLETFIARHKQQDTEANVEYSIVHPEILNQQQSTVYEFITRTFLEILEGTTDPSALNIIVMGMAGVGKSFVIRALEQGIWNIAREKFGQHQYPTIRSVVKLVAFTGKAAYQVEE
jgi:hypothetical protein